MAAEWFDALTRVLATDLPRHASLRVARRWLGSLTAAFVLETVAFREAGACRRVGKKCHRKDGKKCCAGAKCRGGRCKCTRHKQLCGGRCIAVTDCCTADDCSACESCQEGQCVAGCQPDQTCQNEVCVCAAASCTGCCDGDTCRGGTSDTACGTGGAHCADCGADRTCHGGTCVCAGSLVECSGQCVDLETDDRHCGDCDNPCAGTATCEDGVCAAGGTYDQVLEWDGSSEGGPFQMPIGVGINRARFVYVTDAGVNSVQKFTASGDFVAVFPSAGSSPAGIGFNLDTGHFYVAARLSEIVAGYDSDDLFDGTVFSAGSSPFGVAVESGSGNVYVAGMGTDSILLFTSGGTFIERWEAPDYDFLAPQGVAVAPNGDVYVADTGNNRIQRFTSAGDPRTWTTSESLNAPAGVAVDAASDVYVADTANNRIVKFAADGGTPIGVWGSTGAGDNQFDEPIGIAINRSALVYIVDSGNDRVVVYEPS